MSKTPEDVILLSRSGQEDLDTCPRMYYYRYKYRKTGVDGRRPNFDLLLGLGTHKALEGRLLGKDLWDEALQEMAPLKKGEDPGLFSHAADWLEGTLLAADRVLLPRLLAEYQVLSVEKELRTLLAGGVGLASRCDAILRSNLDGRVYVLNWKTSGSFENWSGRWLEDVQSWTEGLAAEQDLQEEIAGILYVGLFKGSKRNGRLTSPILWVYRTKAGRLTSKYVAGAEKLYVPDTIGFEEHFKGDISLEEQFQISPPIPINRHWAQEWLRGVVRVQTEAKGVLDLPEEREADRLDFFRQKPKPACTWCPFLDICRGMSKVEDLVEQGLLVERIDHHGGGRDTGTGEGSST